MIISSMQQERILHYLGLSYEDKGDRFLCLSPFRSDHHPDLTIYKDRAYVIDYAGNFRGSILKMFYVLTGKLAKDVVPDLGLEEPSDTTEWNHVMIQGSNQSENHIERKHGVIIDEAAICSVYDDLNAYRYCISRGLDDTLIEKWNIKYAQRCRVRGVSAEAPGTLFLHRILIPITIAGTTWSIEGRMIRKTTNEEKHRVRKVLYPKGCSVDTLFQDDLLDRKSPLVVVEGLMDLARVRKVYSNSTCTFGIGLSPGQIKLLNSFNRVILLPDSDKGGDIFIDSLADALDRELYVARVPEKDPGESTSEHIQAAVEGARGFSDILLEKSRLFETELPISWITDKSFQQEKKL